VISVPLSVLIILNFFPIYFVWFKYSQTPTERRPLSSLMKVCQQTFPTFKHKLRCTLTVALYRDLSESCVSYTVNRRHRTTSEENLLASNACNLEFQPFPKTLDFGSISSEKNLEMFNY